LTVAFTLLIATIQLTARLQRTSLLSAAAGEAAAQVARGEDPAVADARLRRLLGATAAIDWSTGPGGVRVDVVVVSPTVPGLSTRIHRGATARWERVR
jgi:hypothetical protein